MSSGLRLSIIMVLLLASAALGLIAYNANAPKAPQVEVAAKDVAPMMVAYFVAARPLRARYAGAQRGFCDTLGPAGARAAWCDH